MKASDVARMAASKIEKATQNPKHHTAVLLRQLADENAPMLRIQLHSHLQNSADSFSHSDTELSKALNQLCHLLDGMPQE